MPFGIVRRFAHLFFDAFLGFAQRFFGTGVVMQPCSGDADYSILHDEPVRLVFEGCVIDAFRLLQGFGIPALQQQRLCQGAFQPRALCLSYLV